MKISQPSSTSPISSPALANASKLNAIKMRVNATPGVELPSEGEQLSIPDDSSNNNDITKPTVEATEPLSPQFADLAKQRRALQQERRAFEDAKKAAAAASQGSDSVDLARLKSEPLSVLLEAGVTFEQLTEAVLNQGNQSEVTALKAELNAFKEGIDKKLSDRDAQAEQQVLSEMKREAERLIVSNDEFELVRATSSVPDVMKLIERTYKETGEVLEVSEALKLVEDELFNRHQKLVPLKKMQGLFQRPAEASPAQQRHPGIRTLTNKDTASVQISAKARAIAAFNGTLKK